MDLLEKAKNIELVVFDVDGVMTDGGLFFGDDGQEYKAFHSKDGHGMRMLHEAGIRSAIITGRQSNVVEHRRATVTKPRRLTHSSRKPVSALSKLPSSVTMWLTCR